MKLTGERAVKLLILILMGFIGGCSYQLRDPQPVPSPNQVAKDQPKSVGNQEPNAPVYEEPIFLPSIELPEIKGSVTQQSPVRLINLQVIVSKSRKRALVIEIENVSKKPVQLAHFLLHYPQCDEFLYKGGIYLAYGDPALANSEDPAPVDPVLQPSQRVSKKFDGWIIDKFLNRKTFKNCPEGKNRPHMNLLKVWFEDGTVWDPVEAEMQYRKSQQQKPKS
ncbi:MAG TPA: hypothetical protein PLB18_10940 [Acidobacteriota bacterium]|nr:hypothetical protein [Acidobacteriota bacterium]